MVQRLIELMALQNSREEMAFEQLKIKTFARRTNDDRTIGNRTNVK